MSFIESASALSSATQGSHGAVIPEWASITVAVIIIVLVIGLGLMIVPVVIHTACCSEKEFVFARQIESRPYKKKTDKNNCKVDVYVPLV